MQIFQILHGFCHWRTPFKSLEETKGFPSDCIFVEAPDYVNEQWGFDDTKEGDERFIRPEPPEGWLYDEETGSFFPETDLPMMLEREQTAKQNENKMGLASFLSNHPLTYTDGKTYGVTYEDQQEIQFNLYQWELNGDESATVQWHDIHQAASEWTYDDLMALYTAIQQYVYPWVALFNEYKAKIYACEAYTDVYKIEIVYKTDEEIEADKLAAEEEAKRQAEEEAARQEEEARRAAEEAEASANSEESTEGESSSEETSEETTEEVTTEGSEEG